MNLNKDNSITVNEIPECLDIAALTPQDTVFCFVGSQGLGKTEQVRKGCKDNKKRLVPFSLVQRGPIELSGMFMPDEEHKKMKIYDCEILSTLTDNDVLFFDELFESSAEVQAACLTILQERELISGKKLPEGLIICAATNRTAHPSSIKDNFKDRFEFINIRFDLQSGVKYTENTLNINLHDNEYIRTHIFNLEDHTEDGNVITPRTLGKGIKRYVNADIKQREYIIHLLNAQRHDEVISLLENLSITTDIIKQIFDCIDNTYKKGEKLTKKDQELLDKLEECKDPLKMFELIQSLSKCKEIEEALKTCELEV